MKMLTLSVSLCSRYRILILSVITSIILLPALTVAAGQGKIVGLEFVGHQVSDLDKAVKFYETLDFRQAYRTGWQVDEPMNRLGGIKAAESRTAIMSIQSSVSDIPFTLILREYRGIKRDDWSSLSSSDLLSSHIDLTVQDDCNPYMDRLKAINMLKVPNMNLRGGAEDSGPRRFVFVQDPDGWFIELFAIIPLKVG